MTKFIVTYTRIPTAYNEPSSLVVEAATEDDALAIVKDHLRDFASFSNFTRVALAEGLAVRTTWTAYTVKPYTQPPPGKIIGRPE
jgi:hypothetical protein